MATNVTTEGTADLTRATTSFTRMQDSTPEDYALIAKQGAAWNRGLAERVLIHLQLLAGETGGYGVDRLTHSLQSATRAERDGKDEEYVVSALIHDIGDTLASYNHSEFAATILQPFVSERCHWIVKHHGIFQGYYFFHHWGMDRHLREQYKDSPYYRDTIEFCALYDQNCFDPEYDTLPLDHFAPAVHRLFSAPRESIYLRPAAKTES
jgi:predicted HD phosphohydrolase